MAEKGTEFGVRLRACRVAAGLSQEDLVQRSGLDVRTIRNLERGRARLPYPDTVRRLADALGLRGADRDAFTATAGRRLVPGTGDAGNGAAAGTAPGGLPAGGSGLVIPRELPGGVRAFTGRAEEMAMLSGLLEHAGQTAPGTVVISAIGGTAGVGKTALAMHWAHQVAGRFPDGQLYANLRGYDPGQPKAPADVLAGFLRSLSAPGQDIPPEPDRRAARYRSLLAGKQMLIMLDNARSAEQVRPLLPGAGSCITLVTSRDALSGLVAGDGAIRLDLDLLPPRDAVALLRTLIGQRVDAEPTAAAELTGLCARLPLALVIAAARAVARPDFPLAALAAELRGTHTRLDALGTGDAATEVRTVFSWSYQQLSSPAASMFRLLSIHPGPDITAPAAASLAGIPRGQARQALAELARAHLVAEHVPGRFAFHDLLRTYAADQALAEDSCTERRAAIHRMLDHYLHTACAAAMLISPSRDPLTLAPAQPGVSPEDIADREQAVAWFQAERQVLLAAVIEAEATGLDVHAWQIPWALANFLQYWGHWNDYAVAQRAALAATQRLGDLTGQARAHYNLALAVGMASSYADAGAHLARSLGLRQQLGDSIGQARSHIGLGWIFECQGRYRDALDHAQHALGLFRAAEVRVGESEAISAVGWYHALLGDYELALVCSQEAFALASESDDNRTKAGSLDTIGYAHHHLGHHAEAIASYQHALDLYRQIGGRHVTTLTLRHLGDAYHAVGDLDRTRETWQQALDILDDLQHADADQVRAKLSELAGVPGNGPIRG
jgi:tetratricopeptide (TPR) repeat protein/DNA-binding XRE family transcriptional regulator